MFQKPGRRSIVSMGCQTGILGSPSAANMAWQEILSLEGGPRALEIKSSERPFFCMPDELDLNGRPVES